MRGDTGFPVRVRYAKRGKIRWISHRDVARAFERALRIERLPLAFTLGFSPRPKVSFGLALSTGYESEAEYLDLELSEPIDLPLRKSVLDGDVLSFYVAQFAQSQPDALGTGGLTSWIER